MKYRIEYADGRRAVHIQSRPALLERLGQEKREDIRDVRKVFKHGLTETVLEKYERYIR